MQKIPVQVLARVIELTEIVKHDAYLEVLLTEVLFTATCHVPKVL